MKKFLIGACCPFLLPACGNNTTAKTPPPEYVVQKIATDFEYGAWKNNELAAKDRINERFEYYAKNACHRVGYGWSFTNIIGSGQEDCEVNPQKQLVRCRLIDVELECRRIKPGTVGMGMIPFT